VIYLVDDDWQLMNEITEFLTTLGMNVVSFASAVEYLAFAGNDTAACVILNIYLPDISGLELQRRLAERENTPVIFVSDQCDVPSTVSAMKAGAIEFLTKPVDLRTLLAAIRLAWAQDRKQRQRKAHRGQVMRKMKAESFADLVRMAPRLRSELARVAPGWVQVAVLR
jgi:FixJ family two-component response regulator